MKTWEIERAFNEEIREKRKAGSGAFHKRGKGVKHGFSGALRTPSYYMSAKEKAKLNGEVEVSFMYETIIPIEEFKLKDKEIQKTMLTRWRDIYPNAKIVEEMKISNKMFYDLVADLEIPKKARVELDGTKRVATAKAKTTKSKQAKEPEALKKIIADFAEERKSSAPEKMETLQAVVLNRGMTLNYHDEYTVEELDDIFSKCQIIINGAKYKYKLALTLTEIKEE
jgi:hypothetical protein